MKLHWTILTFWAWGGFCPAIGMYVNTLLSMNHDKQFIDRSRIMYNKKIFWTCVLFLILGLLIGVLVCGCKPKRPARLSFCIACGDNGKDKGWFAYQTPTGETIEQEGVGMDWEVRKSCYLKNNGLGGLEYVEIPAGIQEVKSTGVTGAGGQMTATGKRMDFKSFPGILLYSEGVVSSDHCSGAFFDYRTIISPFRQHALAQYGSGRIGRYIAKPAMFTELETDALNSTPAVTSTEITSNLVQIQGNDGGGFPKEMNSGFLAVNLTEPEKYLRHSAPFMFDFIVRLAETENLAGMSIPVIISTGAFPQGIRAEVSIIASSDDGRTHIARSEKFLPVDSSIDISCAGEIPVYDRWTPFPDPNICDPNQYDIQVDPGWLSLIDPNLWNDPNICPDPNVFFNPSDPNFFIFTSRLDTTTDNFMDILIPERIMSVKVIPINKEDYVYIEIDWSNPRMVILASEYWLTSRKMYDFNNDGIVNFGDWQ